MSAKFCLLIPSKILRIEKHFGQKLDSWLAEAEAANISNCGLSNYALYSLSEFQKHPDVNLNLPDNIGDRYYVIDWGFYFMSDAILHFQPCTVSHTHTLSVSLLSCYLPYSDCLI